VNTAAFDPLARQYDSDFTGTGVGRALREIVWSVAADSFRDSRHVLELGCGTGEDAVCLARMGIKVTATDASAEMVRVAQEKTCRLTGIEPIELHRVPMEGIASSLRERRFDGVFSNFGAINCVSDVPALAASLAGLLTPGAPLLWVIMGRRVPWEWLWYLMRGDTRRAFRRFQKNGVEWRGLRIFYPTPAEVAEAIKPYFQVRRVAPLGCVLPPSYAASWLNSSPRTLAALSRLEWMAQRSRALAGWSDHYILEAHRVPASKAGSSIGHDDGARNITSGSSPVGAADHAASDRALQFAMRELRLLAPWSRRPDTGNRSALVAKPA
jgi:ubiquinone/menaquinone biosynthesis C-methylase UbiE